MSDFSIRAIAVTKPLISAEENGKLLSSDEFIAFVARVSNPSNQNNTLTANKLLQYLIKNNHYSPFEMVHLTIEVNTTRDIARQILRHRSFSFQEFSQRYADPTSSLGFTTRDARLQDTKNRQNSLDLDDTQLDIQDRWQDHQDELIKVVEEKYAWAIKNGIAKEQARAVLPEGLTKSRLYMAGTIRSWIHYCQLRSANGTQKEHREIAQACWKEVLVYYPALSAIVFEPEAEPLPVPVVKPTFWQRIIAKVTG